MPGLDEVYVYLRGLWLFVARPEEAPRHLDGSLRGFWRSFWAMAYCIPPILLSWSSYRMSWLAGQGENASTGPGFFLSLAAIEILVWIIPMIGMALVMISAGQSRALLPVLVAQNWLNVAASWLMAIPSILSILAGDGGMSALFVYLVLATGFLAFQGMVFNAIVGQNRLLAGALVLTGLVLTFYASSKLQALFGLV